MNPHTDPRPQRRGDVRAESAPAVASALLPARTATGSRGRPTRAEVLTAVIRCTRLAPLGFSSALSLLIMLVPIVVGTRFNFLDATLTLHLAMTALMIGAAFVLDDPARTLTEVLPISVRRVTALRAGLSMVAVSIVWALLLLLAPYTVDSSAAYPRAGLVIEAYALLAWMWVIAAHVAARQSEGLGGVPAAGFLLTVVIALALLPEQMAFFLPPGSSGYDASRWRWAALLIAALAAVIGRHTVARHHALSKTHPPY